MSIPGGFWKHLAAEKRQGVFYPHPERKLSQDPALVKHHLGSDSAAAAELKASGEDLIATAPRPEQGPDSAPQGWSSPLLGIRGIWGGYHPPQLGHPPDVEEEHLSDAQQADGDGEGKKGDTKEDVLGFVPATQREGGTREQEETTAQEPLWGCRDVTGCCGVPSTPGAQGLPSPHLQEVEHEGGHPAPAVQAVHVRDALGPVGLEDGDDACGEEPVTTGAGSSPIHPSQYQHSPTRAMTSARPWSSACSTLVERLASCLKTR